MISSRNMASNRSQRRGALEDSQLFDLLYDWDENDDMDFDPPDVAAYLEEALSVVNLLLFFVNHKLILFFLYSGLYFLWKWTEQYRRNLTNKK